MDFSAFESDLFFKVSSVGYGIKKSLQKEFTIFFVNSSVMILGISAVVSLIMSSATPSNLLRKFSPGILLTIPLKIYQQISLRIFGSFLLKNSPAIHLPIPLKIVLETHSVIPLRSLSVILFGISLALLKNHSETTS